MAVLPKGMNPLSAKELSASLRTVENYIAYMREQIEHAFSMANKNKSSSGSGVDTVGKVYKGAWIATECTGISQHYTDAITLPAGTYIISVVAPYCADFTARVCINFSAKLAIGTGTTFIDAAHGTTAMIATFTDTTSLWVLSGASNNEATWSDLDRGGIAAVRIA